MPEGGVGVKDEGVQFAPLEEKVRLSVARHVFYILLSLFLHHIIFPRLVTV